MKTKVLLLAILAGFVFSSNAQEFKSQIGSSKEAGYKTDFKKNKFGDNWFISIAGGASDLMADQNDKADFSDRLNFAPQFSFGKWFSPYLGFRTQLNGGSIHGFQTIGNQLQMQHNKYIAAHVDLLWDVTNYWAPYNESKVFRLIPWVGLGYAIRFKNDGLARSESPTINAGLLTAFRLSNRVDLNVELQGSMLQEHFNRFQEGHTTDGIVQLSAGLTFKLGKSNFEVLEPMDYALLNDLNGQINNLRAENQELNKRPKSCPECPEPVATVVTNNVIDNVVFFRLNSAKVDKNQQINIFNTSEFVKEYNTPVKVIGYADKKTGSSDYNLKLSEKRARAVAKDLMDKYGISSDKITIEWKGSDEQPYNENNWNRVVIMRAEK